MTWHVANASPEGRVTLLKTAKQVNYGDICDNALVKPTF